MAKTKLLKTQVKELEDKLYELEVERADILIDYNEALSQGDLRENSAYTSSKERLKLNDIEKSKVQSLLEDYEIVDESQIRNDVVDIGSKVHLTDSEGKEYEFTFVTDGQGSILKKTISQLSDLGNAIFGKEVNDVVTIKSSSGEFNTFTIVKIN